MARARPASSDVGVIQTGLFLFLVAAAALLGWECGVVLRRRRRGQRASLGGLGALVALVGLFAGSIIFFGQATDAETVHLGWVFGSALVVAVVAAVLAALDVVARFTE